MFAFGDARYLGSAGARHLGSAVVGMAVAPAGRGYLLATSKGDVLRFGAVPLGPAKLAAPLGSAVAAMAATPDAKGYWLVTTKGKVVPFGDAHNYGSMTGALKAAIVGIAPTANGKGYWLAARDGAVFAFGDAHQAVAGHQAAPKAQGPVSAIALSFNAGNPRAKTAHASPTTAPSGGNCTNPKWSTSDAEGTANTDPNHGEYWWVNNDAWSGSHGPQSISVCNQSSWYAVSDQPDNGGQVETYPDTEYDVGGRDNGLSTKPISAYNSITSTFSEDYPAAGSWDAAYDLWTNNWHNETMIWNQWAGSQSYWYKQATTNVTLDGVVYHFIANGSELIFMRVNQVQSGSVDILAAWQWEVANGYAKSTDVPTQLEYGVEVCSTNGNETFPMNGLTFNLS